MQTIFTAKEFNSLMSSLLHKEPIFNMPWKNMLDLPVTIAILEDDKVNFKDDNVKG